MTFRTSPTASNVIFIVFFDRPIITDGIRHIAKMMKLVLVGLKALNEPKRILSEDTDLKSFSTLSTFSILISSSF
jgi:hypothetical protein